jgi:hypothetical protein
MIQVIDLGSAEPTQVVTWVDKLAGNLRQSDLDEIRAMTGSDPNDAVWSSLGISTHAFMVLDMDGTPVAVFGAAPHPLPGVGVVWMVGTDDVARLGFSIARNTRPYFDTLNDAYRILWNYIDDRNKLSMKWLRWGGFRLLAEKPEFGPERRTFHIFIRINEPQDVQTLRD